MKPVRFCKWSVGSKPEAKTLNSEIFVRILFAQNFAYAKFRENKTLAIWQNHCRLLIYSVGKPCLSCKFFTSDLNICLLMLLFTKVKFLRKFPNLQ